MLIKPEIMEEHKNRAFNLQDLVVETWRLMKKAKSRVRERLMT